MADNFLKNPISLFDIRDKSAIVTAASGAFGALAAKTLAGAGANVVLAASKQDVDGRDKSGHDEKNTGRISCPKRS